MNGTNAWHRRLVGFLIVVVLLLLGGATHAQDRPAHWAPVHPVLAQELARSRGPISFLVILDEQPAPEEAMARLGRRNAPPHEKRAFLYAYLTDFARRSQADLRRYLDGRAVSYRPFYIVNAIEVWGDASLVDALRRRPEVNRLAANPRVPIDRLERSTPAGPSFGAGERTVQLPPDLPYGIEYANAPAVWAQGFRGEGVVVASQDTGVDWDHVALKQSYRGWDETAQTVSHVYNWYDAWGVANRSDCDPDPQVPCDDNGHGTHTVGTMVGSDYDPQQGGIIVGVAPEAKWIGCRNMNLGAGTPASYAACFQFFLAPHPQDGDPFEDGDPSKAPHIINNSWYCPPDEGCDVDSLRQIVQTVRAAGQLVVASAGNEGSRNVCATARHPISIYPEVFSVGAHDAGGSIASFSNRGPVTADGSGRLKPQIAAPGVNVMSTWIGDGYGTLSGTSMASPHVAGAVALLWSAAPHLIGHLDETEQILMKSAEPVPAQDFVQWMQGESGEVTCEVGSEAVVPNNTYGYGRLDAAAAVDMALHPSTIALAVRDQKDRPLANVAVSLTDTLTGYRVETRTDESGQARFPRVYTGVYLAQVSTAIVAHQESIEVAANERQVLTVTLSPQIFLPWIDKAEWSVANHSGTR